MGLLGQSILRFRGGEKQFDIAPQVIDAGGGSFRGVPGLREDERALNGSLRVKREAFRSPVCMNVVLAHCLFNVGD